MPCVSHPVADIKQRGLTINNEFDFRKIKDDTKMWFRYYDKAWRRQELDEQIMRNISNNRLSTQIILKYCIK